MDVIEGPAGRREVDDAARIWAEATAARDGDEEVAGLEVSRPIIQGVLDSSPRALLLIARATDGVAAGFAAIEPLGGTDEDVAEVRYLGVRPRMWGQGVGESLLTELPSRLRAAGFGRAVLSVYEDNGRATALYERLGWRAAGPATAHPVTGKPERRYELAL
jgi:ribosomal protein S18 acetylase RimI-like enzyme